MNYRSLAGEGRPDAPRDERLAIFLAGDDEGAKRTVAGLIDELGFAPWTPADWPTADAASSPERRSTHADAGLQHALMKAVDPRVAEAALR